MPEISSLASAGWIYPSSVGNMTAHFLSAVYELLPVVVIALIGAVTMLSGIVLHQSRAMGALRTDWQTDRLHMENRLGTIQQQTCFDALTGLRNRTMFEAKVSTLLRGTAPFALIYIDLDGLKAANDVLGHIAGDRLIVSAVKAIRSALRRRSDRDAMFRRGTAADEFFVILEGVRLTVAIQIADLILMALRSVSVTASIGVAEWDGQTIQTCEQIELAAEQQMQRAKRDGRNCVRWSPDVIEHSVPAALPPGQTLDAVPVEIEAERTERNAA